MFLTFLTFDVDFEGNITGDDECDDINNDSLVFADRWKKIGRKDVAFASGWSFVEMALYNPPAGVDDGG